MPRAREFLERFRPVGTPGAAAAGGAVPVDVRAELAAELAPVLAALSDVDQQSHQIRADADDYARRRAAEASATAEALLADARRVADEQRLAAAAALTSSADAEAARAREAAEQQADAVRVAAAQRLPELLGRVRAAIEAELVELAPGSARDGPP